MQLAPAADGWGWLAGAAGPAGKPRDRSGGACSVATQTGPGSKNQGGLIRTSQRMGTTVAARVAGPTSSVRFRCFFGKDGPGFAPTFRTRVPGPKTGIHELLPCKHCVRWPPRRPTFWAGIRAHFLLKFRGSPTTPKALVCGGGVPIPMFCAWPFMDGLPGRPHVSAPLR